jgi:hypothetical protein
MSQLVPVEVLLSLLRLTSSQERKQANRVDLNQEVRKRWCRLYAH